MKTFKITLAYDGTNYYGWQEQPGLPTVEGLFKKRLSKLFKQEVHFTGASRTDVGVHALGQVARCQFPLDLTAERFKILVNRVLPPDIMVRSVEEVSDEFHPRVKVEEKTYYYHFFVQPPVPFFSPYGLFVKNLDLDLLHRSLQTFKGIHDFRSFCTGDQGRTTVRTINSLEIHFYKRFGLYQIRIKGPSFLRHMIRRIVGACFQVSSIHASPEESLSRLVNTLQGRDPRHNLMVAPAKGLMLHSIKYTR
jgi:tRNA pseudouridine38-40 synthase